MLISVPSPALVRDLEIIRILQEHSLQIIQREKYFKNMQLKRIPKHPQPSMFSMYIGVDRLTFEIAISISKDFLILYQYLILK